MLAQLTYRGRHRQHRPRPFVRLTVAGLTLSTALGFAAVACGPSPLPPAPAMPSIHLTPDDPAAADLGGAR